MAQPLDNRPEFVNTSCLNCGTIIPSGQGGRCNACKPKRTSRPGQAAVYQTPHWQAARAKAIRLADHQCTRCGKTSDLHVHHIKPIAQGGTHDQENLQVLCRSCHRVVEAAAKRQAA